MEKCLNEKCFSPTACETFGYCRERNLTSEWERNGFQPQINGRVYIGWTKNEINIYLPNMLHPDQIAKL